MKKIVLMAFMALSLTAMAQKVTPLTLEIAEVKLDSLRTLYLSEPIMYRASLNALAQALSKNADELKAVKAELKTEQEHAKEIANSLKESLKTCANLKKLYAKEEAELKSMQKVVEGQQKTLSKQKELNKESREGYQAFLTKQQKELGYSLREVADRMRAISELETTIQDGQSHLQDYNQQIVQKSMKLNHLETQLKERTASVKSEQKAAKSLQ